MLFALVAQESFPLLGQVPEQISIFLRGGDLDCQIKRLKGLCVEADGELRGG